MNCRVSRKGRTSRRRQSLRLAIGANKKIMVYSAESQVTVGVMKNIFVKKDSSGSMKASKGVEKSCTKVRRKRGQRLGKVRSRVGKTRRSHTDRPSDPKSSSGPSAHATRLYVWVLRTSNDLYRKGCEKKLKEFDYIWNPPKGRPYHPHVDAYRKCKARYLAILSTAKRGHIDSYPELRLGKNFYEFVEKRRPSDMGDLLGALGVRPSSSRTATGFGTNPDGSFVFGRSKPADLPRDPSGLRRPDTSVVRERIERKRDAELNQREFTPKKGKRANTPCCDLAGRASAHNRWCRLNGLGK
jgi:hypothetical protein